VATANSNSLCAEDASGAGGCNDSAAVPGRLAQATQLFVFGCLAFEPSKKCCRAAGEKTMGLESLVALVASIGSFSMTCMTANTFGIDPPAANPTPLTE
jgi:hypothetical protein